MKGVAIPPLQSGQACSSGSGVTESESKRQDPGFLNFHQAGNGTDGPGGPSTDGKPVDRSTSISLQHT